MFKTRYHRPGTAPATLIAPDSNGRKPVITLLEYDEQTVSERTIESLDQLDPPPSESTIRWINIDGLGDVELFRQLADRYGLHALALEDVLNTSQRPKLELYEGHIFMVAQMIYCDMPGSISTEQVSIFFGEKFLITILEDPEDVFSAVRVRIKTGKGTIRKRGADYLAYALLDAITDNFFPVLESLGDSIEHVENDLLAHPSKETMLQLHEFKRALVQLRRSAWPHREVVSGLIQDQSGRISEQTKLFLRDCYDHSIQIMDLIESYRDLTSGLMDIYLSSVGIRTNEIMRVLTVISSIFIPLTFIAGVYGMNFNTEASALNMPELNSRYGYVACLAVMFTIAVVQLVIFKKKRWI